MTSPNFFNLPNPYSSTMTLALTQPLTEISSRKYFWGVERGRLSRFFLDFLEKCANFDFSQPYRPPRPVTKIALLFTFSYLLR
jgi:hypothetical protein